MKSLWTVFFSFVIDYHSTLSDDCKSCPHCPKCVTADGIKTSMMTVNYTYPGPSVEVCLNDTITVDVFNRMLEPTTIHWHGIKQKSSPNMDGVPYITQYPIQPGQVMRYQFTAGNSGTHWYHSHYGEQRIFGIAGPLIVRQPKKQDPFHYLYDVDSTNQVIFINDWAYNGTKYPVGNLLINGKGVKTGIKSFYENVEVEKGLRYRFRLVFSGYSQCIVEISIDKHSLLVISSDGEDLQSIEVESILLTSGERYDFVLQANQTLGRYWIRAQGKDSHCKGLYQVAALHYKGYENESHLKPDLEPFNLKGIQLNTDFERKSVIDVPIHQVKSLNPYPFTMRNVFKTFYFHINMKNDSYILNGISFRLNRFISLLDTLHLIDDSNFTCNEDSLERQGRDCQVELCECPHMISMKRNELMEIVIVNDMIGTHPVHLHGHSFYVVGQGDFPSEDGKFNAEQLDRIKPFPRNTNHPPVKDTVLVHAFGYTIIRFYTDNSGYWFFHCHIEEHMFVGMALIFKVED